MNKKPCLNCKKRTSTCHSDCLDYILATIDNEIKNENIKKQKQTENYFIRKKRRGK